MLPLWCFLLIPAIIEANTGHYENRWSDTPSNMPMDYNDDLQIKPNKNFVFNFEQLRKDQPPQVEMREENIGRYMYRPTSTVEPFIPETSRMPVINRMENKPNTFSQLANNLRPVEGRYNQHWSSNQAQSTTMPPPPPAPKLNDFADTFSYFDQNQPNQHNLPGSRDIYNRNYQLPEHQPNMQVPATHDSRRDFNRPSAVQQPFLNNMAVQSPSTTEFPRRQNIDSRFADFTARNPSSDRAQQPISNRGSHKFSWNDVSTSRPQYNPSSQQQSTMPPSGVNLGPQSRGPPPPAPTLSAWNDGFGK